MSYLLLPGFTNRWLYFQGTGQDINSGVNLIWDESS